MISLGIFLLTTNEKENYMNQFTPYNFTITNIECLPSNLRNNYQAIFYDNNISITYPNVITGLDKCQGLFNITSNIELYQNNNYLYWSIPPSSKLKQPDFIKTNFLVKEFNSEFID